jgi:PPP family 3-phenylpropionic acid transporter
MKIILSLFYFAYFSLVGVYVMYIPKALVGFGYNSVEIGLIYAAAPFMRFLLPFIFKYYLQLTHKIYLLALLFTFLSSLLFLQTVDNFTAHLFANKHLAASKGVTLPFVVTISLQELSKKMYGKIRLWGSIGFIVVSLYLGSIEPLPLETFQYLVATGFFTLIFGYFVLQYDKHQEVKNQESDSSFSLRRYWAFWASIFLMQVAFGGFYTFFTIYESSQGVSPQIISYFWTFGVLCEIVMLYFQGALLERNLLTILKIATLITAFRWLMLYLFPSSIEITFFTQSLHAVSFALYHTAAITYVFSLYSQKRLAQQFFLGISFGLGGSVGAFIAGFVYGEYLFLFEAVVTLGAFGMLFVHDRRRGISSEALNHRKL